MASTNSFADAAERLTQLTIDLPISGVPVLFSWPSDPGRRSTNPLSVFTSEGNYKQALTISHASRAYLADVMEELTSSSGRAFNALAHSMGTELMVNALLLRQATAAASTNPSAEFSPRALILAAPDISTKEFDDSLRPKINSPNTRITIYCLDDWMLIASRGYHRSDERLGYCKEAKPMMQGIDLVILKGSVADFGRHSYYLSAIEVLDDIGRILGELANRTINIPPPRGQVRELRLR
jgi:esterase/lipase superfamily enzyme